jgi:Pilus formation protein N terminal region
MAASGPARAGPRSQAQAPQNLSNAKRALAIQRYPRIGDPLDARLHFLHDLHGELATGKRTTAEADCVMRGALARKSALCGIAAIALALAAAARAQATEDLIVKYDQSQLLRLPRPAAEIIIGNPSIADVSVQSGNLLVVTGKSFGITNIIALDTERNVIHDRRVLVMRDEGKVVNLVRGTERQSYNCHPSATPPSPSATSRSTSKRSINASQNKKDGQ